VPPTLVSFAVTTTSAESVISAEFKAAGHKVTLLRPDCGPECLPVRGSLLKLLALVRRGITDGGIISAWALGYGGAAEGVFKMCIGNGLGFDFDPARGLDELFGWAYGGFVLELAGEDGPGLPLGATTARFELRRGDEAISLYELLDIYEQKLEPVFPTAAHAEKHEIPAFHHDGRPYAAPYVKTAKPRALIPVFPGTNCEYDTAYAFRMAGAEPEIILIRNLSADGIARSAEEFAARLRQSQMVFIPGGFSGGDEPDGSGKFITAFFRGAAVREAAADLLDRRGGLMAGVCNGFQALIKLGLLPYGHICEPAGDAPTLSFNAIGRYQSRIVRTRVCSALSPWLSKTRAGEIYSVPISHGEGRLLASDELIWRLAAAGQIATQYVDLGGAPTDDIRFNPSGSAFAVEGLCSPDGRVLGKMGHSERIGQWLYKNVPGEYDMKLFEAAVDYFRL